MSTSIAAVTRELAYISKNLNLLIYVNNVGDFATNPITIPAPASVAAPAPNNHILHTQSQNNNNTTTTSSTSEVVRQTRKSNRRTRAARVEAADLQSNENMQVTRRVTRQQTNAARAARRARTEEVANVPAPTPATTNEEQPPPTATITSTTTTTTTSTADIPNAQNRLRQNVIVYNILSGRIRNSGKCVPKESKVIDHCGRLRTFTVFFSFTFYNLLEKRFLRSFREQLLRASSQPMGEIITIESELGKYYIAERERIPNYKYKMYQLLQRAKSVSNVKTFLNFCVIDNRYILSHVRRVSHYSSFQSYNNNRSNLPSLMSTFRQFTSSLGLETASASDILALQDQQLTFYQMQQNFRDRMEQEQFRDRFGQRRSLAYLLPSSELPDLPVQRQRVMSEEQARANFRTFMEMNASTACMVDLFEEKELTVKMSNHSICTMNQAYWKLSQDTEYIKSSHYGHSLVRPVLKIVPYANFGLETNYERCFIVINPVAVTEEELLSMHGQDLCANSIDIGRNIPGCAIEDLHSYLRRRGSLTEQEALNLFYQMCETVRVCHRNGIILRDLKLKRFYFIDEER